MLQTHNITPKLLQGLEPVVQEIRKHPEVIGVLLTGGLARGFADEFSDVDVEVFLKQPELRKWEKSSPIELNQKIGDNEVEIELFDFDDYANPANDQFNWTMENRWDKSQAKILHDLGGEMAGLLKDKVIFREGELEKERNRNHRYAYWFGVMLTESWLARGDEVSAQTSLNTAIEHLVNYLFLKNGQFVPHRKWKFFYVRDLPNLPKDFDRKLEELTLTKTEFVSRVSLFREVLSTAEKL